MSETWQCIYKLVKQVPPGKVATYGQIANLVPSAISGSVVGWALKKSPKDVPWFRIVNAQGKISLTNENGVLQKEILALEGIKFVDNVIDLKNFRHKFSSS